MNTSLATKRIYHEYKDCIFDDINIKIDINEKNMFIWNILIVPNDGFYKDVPLNFELHFPDEYPLTYKIPKLYTKDSSNHMAHNYGGQLKRRLRLWWVPF